MPPIAPYAAALATIGLLMFVAGQRHRRAAALVLGILGTTLLLGVGGGLVVGLLRPVALPSITASPALAAPPAWPSPRTLDGELWPEPRGLPLVEPPAVQPQDVPPAPRIATAQTAATAPPPAWLRRPERLDADGIYRATITLDPYLPSDPAADHALDAELRRLLERYVALDRGEVFDLGFSSGDLRRLLVREVFHEPYVSPTPELPPMQQTHALVSFDDRARKEIVQRYEARLVERRLARLWAWLALIGVPLATIYGSLRWDAATHGAHRGILRAASGVVLCAAAAIALWLLRK